MKKIHNLAFSRLLLAVFTMMIFVPILEACSRVVAAPLDDNIQNSVADTLTAIPYQTMTAASLATSTPLPSPTNTSIPTPTMTPTPDMVYHKAGGVDVPILLYHHIAANGNNNRYFVDPAVFDQQLTWLQQHGYQTITISQLADVIRNGGKLPLRPVVITFDDGDDDLYTGAFPVLEAHHMVAVAYLITSRIGSPQVITRDQVTELIQAGWEIGSHSEHHQDLTQNHDSLQTEVRLSKVALEKEFGIAVMSFAYPYGMVDHEVFLKVVNSGYTSAVGLGEGIHHDESTIYYLERIEIRRDYNMDTFASLMPWH